MVDIMAIREITMECPFCRRVKIKIRHEEGMVSYRVTRSAAAGSKSVKFRTSDRYYVLENCPSCGKTKKEIQNKLDGKEEVDHKKVLERVRKQGLPTRLEF